MSAKPYTVLAMFEAKPGKEQALEATLTGLIGPTLKEQGCINYDLHKSTDNPSAFMFYENWASKEAHAEHLTTPHLKHWIEKMPELLAKPNDVTFWEITQ